MVPPSPEAFGVWMRMPAIRTSASTASATTSAFWSLAMELADFTGFSPLPPGGEGRVRRRALSPDRSKPGVDRVPVQGVEPGGHVVGAPVLILQVVRGLPHIAAEERRQLVHERAVLVGVALD